MRRRTARDGVDEAPFMVDINPDDVTRGTRILQSLNIPCRDLDQQPLPCLAGVPLRGALDLREEVGLGGVGQHETHVVITRRELFPQMARIEPGSLPTKTDDPRLE